ncbi:MAG TPA: ABC transporter permease [Kofleriaceae bacterium]|nr:ABC transporter permease [Kofleriaceae bacterium]
MLRDLAYRVRAILSRRAIERELDDELRFHLERQIEKHVAAGRSREEAARLAHLDLGGMSRVKEECRDARGVTLVEDLVHDVRYGARVLRRAPGFTAAVLLILALGMGVNTALFSVVSGVLLHPLPYRDADRLVTIHESKPNFATGSISFPNFRDWQADNRSIEAMAIYRPISFSLTGAGAAEQVNALLITSDLFSLLGVVPVLGRTFARGEDEVGRAPIALIGAALWQRRFHGSPAVLGETIVLDGRGYSVVGVMPAGFDLFLQGRPRDVYLPIGQWDNNLLLDRGAGLGIHGVGRLRPGVSIEQAQADMDRVTARLAAIYPDKDRGIGARLRPFRNAVVGQVRPTLLVLSGAVALVLLIACVNVANLLLARATGRAREIATRMALGASRPRLLRQLLTESMLLAMAGGALGLVVAAWGTPAALSLLPDQLPRADQISLDAGVLLFALALSLASGIVFGLAPALRATEPNLQQALRDGGRGASGARHRGRDVLIALQMAMVLVLLIGAGLMVRTLSRLWQVSPGIEPAGVMTFGMSFPPSVGKSPPQAIRAHMRRVNARLEAIPGIEQVSMSAGAIPLLSDDERQFWPAGQPRPATTSEMSWTLWYVVEPPFREAMGIPLRRGRFLGPQDVQGGPLAVVADEVFARQYYGDADPIGKRIQLDGTDRPAEIVGVVGHVRQWGVDSDDAQPLRAQLYFSLAQIEDDQLAGTSGIDVIVRSGGARPVPFDTIRAALQAMSPEQVAFEPLAMDDVIARSLAARRFSMLLLSAFAALALILASVGIYGVISYVVGQRTQEIGIRVALGARRGDVLRLILGHGLMVTFAGIALGLAAALALTRLLAHQLYGVGATDPLTFTVVAAGLAAVALVACYLPARRALRVAPMVALRHE